MAPYLHPIALFLTHTSKELLEEPNQEVSFLMALNTLNKYNRLMSYKLCSINFYAPQNFMYLEIKANYLHIISNQLTSRTS